MEKILKPGDYIWYIDKNEIGVIKSKTEKGCFAFFNSGQTAAHISFAKFEKVNPWDAADYYLSYQNSRHFKDLSEKRVAIITKERRKEQNG